MIECSPIIGRLTENDRSRLGARGCPRANALRRVDARTPRGGHKQDDSNEGRQTRQEEILWSHEIHAAQSSCRPLARAERAIGHDASVVLLWPARQKAAVGVSSLPHVVGDGPHEAPLGMKGEGSVAGQLSAIFGARKSMKLSQVSELMPLVQGQQS